MKINGEKKTVLISVDIISVNGHGGHVYKRSGVYKGDTINNYYVRDSN